MEDDQIIDLYWQRQERAIRETDHKYGSYCFAIANHILSNSEDSEECVNDTWLRAWNAMPPGRPGRLKLFLAKITRNLSLDKWKYRTARKRGAGATEMALEELQDCIAGTAATEDIIVQKELAESINRFLRSLPERECSIFLRRYFYLDTIKDIAKRYALKESNVLMILSRSRSKLRTYLEKEGYIL